MIRRREFLQGSLASSLLASAGMTSALHAQQAAEATPTKRPRIAFLGTVVFQHSHAQHFLDRHTLGYAWNGHWQAPRLEVASVYIDQFPQNDLAKGRIARHRLKQFPSIAEALTLGGSKLAVDGVVIIGEHGDYPKNEKGQVRYPRYQWFKEVVKVFEASGRSVPVFNDKHLSTDWNECAEMVADSKRLGFPFLAGSSLPVTWRLPSYDLPHGAPLEASVCVAYGGVDSYDFHALETAQCMSERRAGGEVGIRAVQALRGEALYAALETDARKTIRELLVSALTRSHNLPVKEGYPTDAVTYAWVKQTFPNLLGYLIDHRDGFQTGSFLTEIRDFNYAGKLRDTGEVVGCQMYLPMPGQSSTTADFFNPLIRHVETMMITGKAPYPVERTLLTSGMVIAAVDSLHQQQARIETPQMSVAYQVEPESTFW